MDLTLKRCGLWSSRVYMDQMRFLSVLFSEIPRAANLRWNKSRIVSGYFKSLLHRQLLQIILIKWIPANALTSGQAFITILLNNCMNFSIYFENVRILKRKLTKIYTQFLLQEASMSIKLRSLMEKTKYQDELEVGTVI